MNRGRTSIKVLGIMTGTSCDGLDASCLSVDTDGWEILWEKSANYPAALRKRVLEFQKPGNNPPVRNWLELSRDLGEWYGKTLNKIIDGSKESREERPDVIANHGQTLGHFPASNGRGVTLQAGDPTRIAHKTGLTVVSHFRDGDIAAGGQGAPLVPLFHKLIAYQFSGGQPGTAIHNIGGISNLTYIGPNDRIVAFDTGPGNLWIDAAAEQATRGRQWMDDEGRLALRGQIDEKAITRLLKHPYFSQRPPKSTGRDDFPLQLLLSNTHAKGPALVATATAFTVETIARAYTRWIVKKGLPLRNVILCGGGAKNLTLLAELRARMPEVNFTTFDDLGINAKYIEAQAFAFFGFLALLGRPVGGPWTGVKGFGPPAHVVPGKNWKEVVDKISAFV